MKHSLRNSIFIHEINGNINHVMINNYIDGIEHKYRGYKKIALYSPNDGPSLVLDTTDIKEIRNSLINIEELMNPIESYPIFKVTLLEPLTDIL